jgi:hypothetical protein
MGHEGGQTIRALRTPQRAFRVAGFLDILGSLVQTTSAQGNYDGYVSQFLAKQQPLVMDPVNPYNKVASQMGQWEAVRLLALSTLETMDANEVVTIRDIFRPRICDDVPRISGWCNIQLRFVAHSESYLRSLSVENIADLQGKRMHPGVVCRSRNGLNSNACNTETRDHIILSLFETLVMVSMDALLHLVSTKSDNKGELQIASDFCDGMLQEVFGGQKPHWVLNKEKHADKDATLTCRQIPIPSRRDDHLWYIHFKLSFHVNDDSIYFISHEILIRRELYWNLFSRKVQNE